MGHIILAHTCSGIEGIAPSEDMGAIAQKRGVKIIQIGTIEDSYLPDKFYGNTAQIGQKCQKAHNYEL